MLNLRPFPETAEDSTCARAGSATFGLDLAVVGGKSCQNAELACQIFGRFWQRPKIPRARQRLRKVVALIRQGVSGYETVSDIETVSGNDEKSSAVSGNGRRFLERASGCGKLWH